MPVVLLVLGVVTAVAGLLLAAPGLTARDSSFDIVAVTPGVVAIVGGLVLIGLGLAVRALQRIELALAARPVSAGAGAGEAPGTTDALDAAVRIPLPPKSKSSEPAATAATQAPTPAEDATLERLRVKFPNLTRVESAPAIEDLGELKNSVAIGRRGNGALPARVAPRFDLKPRSMIAPDARAKSPVFKSVAEARRADKEAGAQAAAPPETVAPPAAAEAIEPVPTAEESQVASVLKSGVVEGMAYTLFSDGSIEAQLPQGTLRFGSITALREHIENAS